MNFCMIILNQSIKRMQNCAIWILIALLLTFLLKIFLKILVMMLSHGMIRLIVIKNDKRPLPTGKNKKVIGMFKDELGGKIKIEFCAPRAKTYTYLMDDGIEKKKAKGTNKCIIKRRIKFKDYTDSVFENKTILRSQLRFKSDLHIVYTEEVNKIAISSNDDKRLQTFDKVTTYPYGTNAFKVCESEIITVKKYI